MSSGQNRRGGIRMLVHYICKNQLGEILEDTHNDAPAVVVAGKNDILPRLEKELLKMQPGESRSVTLKPEQAFGYVSQELFYEVQQSMLQLDCEPELDMMVEMMPDGEKESMVGRIVEIYDKSLLVDCNHPLAGMTLTFEMTRIE